MRKFLKHLAVLTGVGAIAANAQSQPGQLDPQPVINSPNYYYILPKSATRSYIMRQRQARRYAATNRMAQTLTATNAAPGTAAGGAAVIQNPPSAPESFVPTYPLAPRTAPIVPPRVTPRPITIAKPTQPKPAIIEEAESAERVQPISEARGPAYNDKDPLLAYQRDQAEKGNPESQYAIGIRYLTGNGLEQSDVLARQWLEKSSALGNLKARSKLREMDSGIRKAD